MLVVSHLLIRILSNNLRLLALPVEPFNLHDYTVPLQGKSADIAVLYEVCSLKTIKEKLPFKMLLPRNSSNQQPL